MVDVVRVQLKDSDEWVTVAQLERKHAEHYVRDMLSDGFLEAIDNAINTCKSKLKVEELQRFFELVSSAVFDTSRIRLTDAWQEGELQ